MLPSSLSDLGNDTAGLEEVGFSREEIEELNVFIAAKDEDGIKNCMEKQMRTRISIKMLPTNIMEFDEEEETLSEAGFSKEEIEELTILINAKDEEGLKECMERYLDQWRSTEIHIAVTGETGAGKSSFINSMRGLRPRQEGAAAVNVLECTLSPVPYSYPDNNNIILWDLPGVGTKSFPRQTYAEKVGLDKFDAFIIVSRSRFTQDDLWLANQINQLGKRFYFVRSHVDQDIVNNEEDNGVTEEETMEQVRNDCRTNLGELSEGKIFLVSGHLKHELKWDFSQLKLELVKHLPDIKKQAMTLSIKATKKMLEQKRKVLEDRTLWASITTPKSSSDGDPSLSRQSFTLAECNFQREQLAIDEKSLKKYASTRGTEWQQFVQTIEGDKLQGFLSNTEQWIDDTAVRLRNQMGIDTKLKGYLVAASVIGFIIIVNILMKRMLKEILAANYKIAKRCLEFIC